MLTRLMLYFGYVYNILVSFVYLIGSLSVDMIVRLVFIAYFVEASIFETHCSKLAFLYVFECPFVQMVLKAIHVFIVFEHLVS